MATSQSIDVGTCSDSELVQDDKNETARFTFDQAHQYLQFGTYPRLEVAFKSLPSERDPSSLRALMVISTIMLAEVIYKKKTEKSMCTALVVCLKVPMEGG